jgi:K+/H+ antiporter YhaU regulatory subunit KhtT
MLKPLGALQIEETGARFGLIHKADGSYVAPSPRVQLQADDHVAIYGSEASIDRAREKLRAARLRGATPKLGPGR